MSPVQGEALLRGYLNAWAAYGLQLSDMVFFDDTPDLRLDQYPGASIFFPQEPAKTTRYEGEFYDMLAAANQARRTLREMDRSYREGLGDEIFESQENAEYDQLTRIHKQAGTIRTDLRAVQAAPTLEDVKDLANEFGRISAHRESIARLRESDDWDSLGALKRELISLLVAEKNKLFRESVQDVKAQRQ